eukprot:JZ550123.1.p2 GENE.JZ550123.1~~JZ550123.1.p2  ORF type:complete len:222 (+),score=106.44 JZ550123.1:25-690(+)
MSEESCMFKGKKPMRIVIAGAPASGKGTACETIKEKYHVIHVSTGDMFRDHIKRETELGKKVKAIIAAGMLVPDDVTIEIVKDRLSQPDCVEHGWLLDGFPRTEAQAKAFIDAGMKPDVFLLLQVSDEVLVERACLRRSDPETGKIYHLKNNPPPTPEIAARCIQRSDDNEETMKKRLEQYHSNITAFAPLFADIKIEIDGKGKPAEVFAAIDQELSKLVQ